MRIPAFYALVQGVGLAHYWHNQSECFIVQSIPVNLRLPGHDNRPRCPYCTLLEEPMTGRKASPR